MKLRTLHSGLDEQCPSYSTIFYITADAISCNPTYVLSYNNNVVKKRLTQAAFKFGQRTRKLL